jgi:hypothetical protein
LKGALIHEALVAGSSWLVNYAVNCMRGRKAKREDRVTDRNSAEAWIGFEVVERDIERAKVGMVQRQNYW